MNVIKSIPFSIVLLLSFSSFAQSPFDDWSNRRIMKTAKNAERMGDVYNAINLYEAFLERKPSHVNVRQRLATLYFEARNYPMAKLQFELVTQQGNKDIPLAQYYLARCYKISGNYSKAKELFYAFYKGYPTDAKDNFRKLAKLELEGCAMALAQDTSQQRVTLKHLEGQINTGHIEGSPYWVDSTRFFYTALRSDSILNFEFSDTSTANPHRTIFAAQKHQNNWSFSGVKELLPHQEKLFISSFVISPYSERLYCSACHIRWNGQQVCHLYVSELFSDGYEPLRKLPEGINLAKYHSTHPTVAYDKVKGREYIYFASNRDKGKGGWDIYYTYFRERKKEFKAPRNCGSKINSVGDEMSPHFHQRTFKLYFSSNGHPGFGEFDVFQASGERSRWSEPVNLGRQVNSTYDDLFYTPVPEVPNVGILSSNRDHAIPLEHDHCCDDLFHFTIEDYPRVYFWPRVFEKLSKEPVDSIEITITMIDENGEEVTILDDVYTERPIPPLFLEPGKKYKVNVRGDHYLAVADSFHLPKQPAIDSLKKDYFLNDLPTDEIVIPNIYYDFDDHRLRPASKSAIDTSIYLLLISNPRIQVEIGSHTDSKGNKWYNERLSQRRAESVVEYLIRKGIPESRLVAKGYGETSPIAPNKFTNGQDNPEGRQKNRRTTFRIIGKLPYDVIYRDVEDDY